MKNMLTEWRQFLKEEEMSQKDKYMKVMDQLFAEDQVRLSEPDGSDVRGTRVLDGFTSFIGMAMKIQPNLDVEKTVEMYKNDYKAAREKVEEILPQIIDINNSIRPSADPEDVVEDLRNKAGESEALRYGFEY
jgi:hypothetical protein